MKRNLLSIGKMAEMNQVTVPTLRLYDQLGLLKPRHVDGETGYRYYDINQNARLDMIAYMKELGMSLSEIAEVFQKEDLTLIEDILSKKNDTGIKYGIQSFAYIDIPYIFVHAK
mgnify:CR=1 FL=1